jgi:hypothetical protein
MANLRVVYDNVVNRVQSLNASTSAGTLFPINLLTQTKAEVWRSTSTTASLTATWATDEIIGVVALPFCNFTADAQMRVRCYTNIDDTVASYDSGYVLACPGVSLGDLDWGLQPFGVNTYSYGGGKYGTVWFEPVSCRKVIIEMVDLSNTSGYVESARLVIGPYWSPEVNADYGVTVSANDNSRNERNDAGDLKTDRGTISKTLSFNLSGMPNIDRNHLWNIVIGVGKHTPLFVCILPESDDDEGEQIYQVFGKLSKQSAISYQFANRHSTQIEIEEV